MRAAGRHLVWATVAAAAAGCWEEIPPYEALPPVEQEIAAVTVEAGVRAVGRIPETRDGAELDCELAATGSGLRLRLLVAGTGVVVDTVLRPDDFQAYLPAFNKHFEGAFSDLSERIRPYVGFARSGYVGLLFPRSLPAAEEVCRCLASGDALLIEYYDRPRGMGPVKRRLWLDSATGRPVRLERFASGRKVLVIEYLSYPAESDDSSRPTAPARLRLTIPHVVRADFDLRRVRFPESLPGRVLELMPPESAELVRVGRRSGSAR